MERAPGAEPDRAAAEPAAEPAAAPAPPALARPIVALQHGAGNRAVAQALQARSARVLARFSMPLGGGVPAGKHATDLAAFLAIIRTEEARLPPHEQTDTKLMITRLRKLFYGAASWDAHLIPGAAGVAPLYDVQEVETLREEIDTPGPNLLDHVQKETRLVGAPAALANPSLIQEVRMPNGDFVDVGHVLAGLDALNHPGTASGPGGLFPIASNVGAVTWIGDLGSVVGEIIIATLNRDKMTFTDAELQAEIDEFAPAQDMLGNVDAYVIGATFAIGSTAGLRVSDMLEQYYGGGGAATPAGEAARNQRFTIFATQLGLGALSGSAFVNEVSWKATFLPQVQNAAALYVGASTDSSLLGLSARAGAVAGTSMNPTSRLLLDKFVDELRARVAAEAAAPVPVGP